MSGARAMSRGLAIGVALILGGAIGALALARFALSPALSVAIGVAVAGLVYALATRRARRRQRLQRAPFPTAWRAILEARVRFYRALDEPARRRFEGEVAIFLDEQTITGPRGAPLEDELRLLVAASAVVLVFGRPGFHYPRLRDVVVYDQAFDEDYEVGEGKNTLGMVHAQGPILFSARSLRQGFRGERDGRNVGYHELAHVLDFDTGRADGVPGLMPWGVVDPWLRAMHEETAKIEAHRSVLRQYAATNEAELFAVATEVFFEQPERLADKHPALFALLVATYGLDPRSPPAR